MNWPKRGQAVSSAELDPTIGQTPTQDEAATAKTPVTERSDPFAPKKPGAVSPPPAASGGQQENKSTFDYQKKVAMQAGPHLRMETAFADTYDMPESLLTGLKDLFEAIVAHESVKGIITPTKLLEIVRRNALFQGNAHQDAHEFLKVLLDEVVDEVEKYTKGLAKDPESQKGLGLSIPGQGPDTEKKIETVSSWVHELFEGTLTSETRCLTCENISQRDEAFLDLSIDLEPNSSVNSCLLKFSEEEMLCEKNKFHCDNCSGLQEAEKRMKIKRQPRMLALHLKRFEYNEDYTQLHKLFHRVVYPFELILPNLTDDVEDPDRIYGLYAVIVHLGTTPFHGHYVSIIKTKDLGWLLFDDELVLPVDRNYVRNFFGGQVKVGNDMKNNPACAYVLFYQETTREAVQAEQEEDERIKDIPTATHFDSQGIITNTSETNGVLSPVTPAAEDANPFTTPIESSQTAPSKLEEVEEEPSMPRLQAEEPRKTLGMGALGSLKKKGKLDHFRSTSFSVKSKPKFWSSSKGDLQADGEIAGSPDPLQDGHEMTPEPEKETKDKKSSRFGLGRKKNNT